MARLSEKYLAEDQLDYRRRKTGDNAINRETHASRGFAATISGGAEAGKKTNRPVVELSDSNADVILGAITSVGLDGCNVVKNRRFVLQCINPGETSDLRKKVIGTTTVGKVDHHQANDATAFAQKGEIAIIGFDNDDSTGGIGHHYLCEVL